MRSPGTSSYGEQRTGQTSVLREVHRRAAVERQRVVVDLRPTNAQVAAPESFIRHALFASVEEIQSRLDARDPDWYVAWRRRAYLRHALPADGDLLIAGLALAAEPAGPLDPVILSTISASCASSSTMPG